MNTLIQAKVLKGFRDYLPNQEIKRALLIEKLTEAFRFYGFVPIDTPVLEYSEILLRKSEGETEKQVFRFEDNGGRDVALRFDLRFPLRDLLQATRANSTSPSNVTTLQRYGGEKNHKQGVTVNLCNAISIALVAILRNLTLKFSLL